jgi:hypothetical protein
MLVRGLPLLLVLSLPVQLYGWVQSKTSLGAGSLRGFAERVRLYRRDPVARGRRHRQ